MDRVGDRRFFDAHDAIHCVTTGDRPLGPNRLEVIVPDPWILAKDDIQPLDPELP